MTCGWKNIVSSPQIGGLRKIITSPWRPATHGSCQTYSENSRTTLGTRSVLVCSLHLFCLMFWKCGQEYILRVAHRWSPTFQHGLEQNMSQRWAVYDRKQRKNAVSAYYSASPTIISYHTFLSTSTRCPIWSDIVNTLRTRSYNAVFLTSHVWDLPEKENFLPLDRRAIPVSSHIPHIVLSQDLADNDRCIPRKSGKALNLLEKMMSTSPRRRLLFERQRFVWLLYFVGFWSLEYIIVFIYTTFSVAKQSITSQKKYLRFWTSVRPKRWRTRPEAQGTYLRN